MTTRAESMPCVAQVAARWDADQSKVRYYASFEGAEGSASEMSIEVPAEDFDRLTRMLSQEAIEGICYQVSETLEQVRSTLTDFAAFREGLEKLTHMARDRSEGTEN